MGGQISAVLGVKLHSLTAALTLYVTLHRVWVEAVAPT